jgi:uncharacterized protein (TIGR04141 family)
MVAPDLRQKCVQALELYKGKRYRKSFPWLDAIRVVKDKVLQSKLDSELLSSMMTRSDESLWLAPCEAVSRDEIEAFAFDQDASTHDFLDETGTSERKRRVSAKRP